MASKDTEAKIAAAQDVPPPPETEEALPQPEHEQFDADGAPVEESAFQPDMGSDEYREQLAQGYVGSLGVNPDGSERDADYHTLPAVVERARVEREEREAAQQEEVRNAKPSVSESSDEGKGVKSEKGKYNPLTTGPSAPRKGEK